MNPFRASYPFLTRLTLLLAGMQWTAFAAAAAESPEPGGVLVYKSQPWHKANQALAKEYESIRRFSTVLYVKEPEKKERRMTQTLVFEAHDYLPFDAGDTTEMTRSERIGKELTALKDLTARFPVSRGLLEPRIEKWETIRAQAPPAPVVASTPAPTPPAVPAEATGKFRNTELPAGGALGTIRLVNGEEFQAWITALTPTHVKWDEPVKVGSGVYHERVMPLTEVQSLQVYTAEDVARSQFKKLSVPKTSLTITAYKVLYEHYFQLLEKMKTQFGSDPRYPEWHSDIVQIREDMEQAQSTKSLKIDGRWLTREEMQRDTYENSAKVLWASANQMAELAHWQLAVEYCRELETKYPESRTFVKSIPSMTTWLEAFGKDRTSLRALSENPEVAEQVSALLESLKEFDVASAEKSLKLSAEAMDAIRIGNRAEAERLFRESTAAWPRNAQLKIVSQRLREMPVDKTN